METAATVYFGGQQHKVVPAASPGEQLLWYFLSTVILVQPSANF